MPRLLRFALIFLVFASPSLAQKKRVAVLNFEYGTVKSNAQAIFGSDQRSARARRLTSPGHRRKDFPRTGIY